MQIHNNSALFSILPFFEFSIEFRKEKDFLDNFSAFGAELHNDSLRSMGHSECLWSTAAQNSRAALLINFKGLQPAR